MSGTGVSTISINCADSSVKYRNQWLRTACKGPIYLDETKENRYEQLTTYDIAVLFHRTIRVAREHN